MNDELKALNVQIPAFLHEYLEKISKQMRTSQKGIVVKGLAYSLSLFLKLYFDENGFCQYKAEKVKTGIDKNEQIKIIKELSSLFEDDYLNNLSLRTYNEKIETLMKNFGAFISPEALTYIKRVAILDFDIFQQLFFACYGTILKSDSKVITIEEVKAVCKHILNSKEL